MRPYVRPLVVTFSTLALATLFSYLAVALTEPSPKPVAKGETTVAKSEESREIKGARTFTKAKMEAAGGKPEKLIALANCYLLGIGTEPSEVEAAKLHRRGAEQGDGFCQYTYGFDLLLGAGVKKDPAAGLAWIRKAAAQHVPEAEFRLFEMYKDGEVVKKDEKEARQWLLLAAEHGQADARVGLAEEIILAKDTERYKAVATWVRKAAMEGHAKSCHVMSFVYQAGIGVKKDPVESVAWRLVMLNADDEADADGYKSAYDELNEEEQAAAEKRAKELCGQRPYKSAYAKDPAELAAERKEFAETKHRAEAGDDEATFSLARMYYQGTGTKADAEETVRWFRRAAERGHADSQYMLGLHLAHGDGTLPDPKEAYQWYLKAALQGQSYAERSVAVALKQGSGVKADLTESLKWLKKSAEHGLPVAQVEFGNTFFAKEPDLVNDTIAVRWYRKAAEQFEPRALLAMGFCYHYGRGVAKDEIEAMAWVSLGRGHYDEGMELSAAKLFENSTEEELLKVKERAAAIRKECLAKMKAERKPPADPRAPQGDAK